MNSKKVLKSKFITGHIEQLLGNEWTKLRVSGTTTHICIGWQLAMPLLKFYVSLIIIQTTAIRSGHGIRELVKEERELLLDEEIRIWWGLKI